jgi:hypothetical protein
MKKISIVLTGLIIAVNLEALELCPEKIPSTETSTFTPEDRERDFVVTRLFDRINLALSLIIGIQAAILAGSNLYLLGKNISKSDDRLEKKQVVYNIAATLFWGRVFYTGFSEGIPFLREIKHKYHIYPISKFFIFEKFFFGVVSVIMLVRNIDRVINTP